MTNTLEQICENKLTKRTVPPLQYDEFEECSCFNCSGYDTSCLHYRASGEVPQKHYKLQVGVV